MDIQGKNKDDFTCPICMYIMIQPVTMPCKHSLCMMCYKQCVEKAQLACPICRLRISVWARKNSKANTLVDKGMWETIQNLFPIEVKNQIEGKESSDDNWDSPSYIETELRKIKDLSEPGEIRQEYEAALAKLQRQKEEEAKKEEEASVALIRALQEEEEEELSKLVKEREELDKLGRQAAENLKQVESHSPRLRKVQEMKKEQHRSKSRNGNREKRCESASTLKLDSFYNSFRKSSNSAPPYSELATTLSCSQEVTRSGQGSRTKYSPYPYPCISPSDKRPKSPSFPLEVANEEEEIPDYCLSEHSYTTASAGLIDLTSQGECVEFSILRDDVQQFMKTEPPDIDEENPLTGNSPMRQMSHVFQPISSSLRTPPKKLPTGEVVDPELIRTVPRSLTFCGGQLQVNSSPSPSSCSSEIIQDQSWFPTVPDKKEAAESLCRSQSPSSSVASQDRLSVQDDYLDKIKMTQKIVNATTKHIKKHPISSSCSSSVSIVQSSSLPPISSSLLPTSSSTTASQRSVCPSSPVPSSSPVTVTAPVPVSSSLRCINNNVLDNSKNICANESSDYFITDDTQLVIPLEADIKPIHTTSYGAETPNENWEKINHLDIHSDLLQRNRTSNDKNHSSKTSHSALKSKTKSLQKKTSRSKIVIPPATSSIRDWCMASSSGSKRKTSADAHSNDISASFDFTKDSSRTTLTVEEADRLIALELQEKFDRQDKFHINVDRFEGSSNEYSLRKAKKRRMC